MFYASRLLFAFSFALAAACSSDERPTGKSEPSDEEPGDASSELPKDASNARADASKAPTVDASARDARVTSRDADNDDEAMEPSDGERGDEADAGARDESPDAASPTVRSTGPGDWGPGDYPKEAGGYLEITGVEGQAGKTRQYRVHVPPSYDPAKPTPVVFCIHGLGQNGIMSCTAGADMIPKSDAEGFILVMPNGYQNSWNGGTCCGAAVTEKLDDVALIRAIFKEVSGHLNIDLSRVYAIGLSNGAYLSYRLACEAADIFAAVAPGAGAIGMNDIGGGTATSGDFAACKPSEPVAVLDLHGTADGLIRYALQKPSLERIAMLNGCMLTTRAATQPTSAGDTMCVSYEGCMKGGEVTGCTVMGGGHVWFGNATCGTGAAGACAIVGANSKDLNNTDAVWAFFKTHPRE